MSGFPIAPQRVLSVVADAYGITVEALTGPSKRLPESRARVVAYQLLHDESQLSWSSIAALMNRAGNLGRGKRNRPADPEALEELRHLLRPNGNQRTLWP